MKNYGLKVDARKMRDLFENYEGNKKDLIPTYVIYSDVDDRWGLFFNKVDRTAGFPDCGDKHNVYINFDMDKDDIEDDFLDVCVPQDMLDIYIELATYIG